MFPSPPCDVHYCKIILQRIRIILGDAVFEPETSDPLSRALPISNHHNYNINFRSKLFFPETSQNTVLKSQKQYNIFDKFFFSQKIFHACYEKPSVCVRPDSRYIGPRAICGFRLCIHRPYFTCTECKPPAWGDGGRRHQKRG